MQSRRIETPVGGLILIGGDDGLRALVWPGDVGRRVRIDHTVEQGEHPVLAQAAEQLDEYFFGERRDFDIAFDPMGTEFQRTVWAALTRIPHGKTSTYKKLAIEISRPNAVRAVGAANGRNPISIMTPCHRLIGSDGSLTGYAGGLKAKRWLLDHEAASA